MARVCIGVGSNIEPETHIPRALALLQEAVCLTAVSTFFRTPALGAGDQPEYVNGVFGGTTRLAPRALKFGVLRRIEAQLGRRREADRYAARSIDLDLLCYDDLALVEDGLCLPDPEIARRAFWAVPLCEVAPEFMIRGEPICRLAARLHDPLEPLPDFTGRLRALLHERMP
mgnify:CR=1 FL=1